MGAGKIFCILGGIITLLATFLFSLASFEILPGVYFYLYFIGFLRNIGAIFSSGEMIIIIVAIVFLVCMISGFLILGGVKSRAIAIIGSILAIMLGAFLVLAFYNVLPPDVTIYILLLFNDALVAGIIPLDVSLGVASLGTFLFLGGGILGLIGGILGTDDL
ncbi:MAG: hypothetical protein KGD65_04310 [Candidatus Lokiarchaeota archaeon]|nr:hypothetical protein [Candidatus Lokiarchaeota archaeon]